MVAGYRSGPVATPDAVPFCDGLYDPPTRLKRRELTGL
jgi:hypothetical protein